MCCYNGRILKLHVSKVIKFYLSFIQNYLLVVGDCLAAKTSRTNTQQRRRWLYACGHTFLGTPATAETAACGFMRVGTLF
jgi:hypothetical protein